MIQLSWGDRKMRILFLACAFATFWLPTVQGADRSIEPLLPPPGVAPPLLGGGAPPVEPPPDFYAPQPPLMMTDFAWSYVDAPKPHEIKVHDIITVTVKENASTNAKSVYNRQRNGQYTAQLSQFIRINNQGNLDNAAENSPEVNSSLQSQLQSTGQVTETEMMTYRIAAT